MKEELLLFSKTESVPILFFESVPILFFCPYFIFFQDAHPSLAATKDVVDNLNVT
jgi:hypothetical protein